MTFIIAIGEFAFWGKYTLPQMKTNRMPPPPESIQQAFSNLPPSLQWICGKVQFPPDHGRFLMQLLHQGTNTLFGTSNGSLKGGQSTHAWIISI
jgi:hypothetical protein